MCAHPFHALRMRATFAMVAATVALLLVFCSLSSAVFNSDVSFLEDETFYVGAEPYRAHSALLNYGARSLPLIAMDGRDKAAKKEAEKSFSTNIGLMLRGNRAVPTIFSFKPLVKKGSESVRGVDLRKKTARQLARLCHRNYTGSLSLGSLNGVFIMDEMETTIQSSYPLGTLDNEDLCTIINSFDFEFYYKTDVGDDGKKYITVNGFVVRVSSKNIAPLNVKKPDAKQKDVTFKIYSSANWVLDQDESKMLELRNKWYDETDRKRHQRGHVISSLNVFLIWAVVGMLATTILFRTIRRDLLEETDAEQLEDLRSGGKWKLVQGDVFRPPSHAIVFSSVMGAGVQLIFMIILTFLCSAVGVLHPSQQGNLLTGLVFTYIFSSSICGFVVAQLLKLFKVEHNMKALIASLLLPFTLSVGYFTMNIIQWLNRTGVAAPISTMALLLVLELFLAIPLVFVGVVLGYRVKEISVPCKASPLPRLIPVESKRITNMLPLMGSILPFLASFIEMTYVFDSMWQNSPFYRLSVLFWQSLVILSLCAEVSIVVTYVTLSQQNYLWWWKSFSSVAYCGLYVFLYSIYYMLFTLRVHRPMSILMFCGYMGGFSMLVTLVTGTVGFFSSFLFVRLIYSVSKAE